MALCGMVLGHGSFRGCVLRGLRRMKISVQQLFHLAVLQLGILSHVVEGVRLHNLPVVEHSVQQVLRGAEKDNGFRSMHIRQMKRESL